MRRQLPRGLWSAGDSSFAVSETADAAVAEACEGVGVGVDGPRAGPEQTQGLVSDVLPTGIGSLCLVVVSTWVRSVLHTWLCIDFSAFLKCTSGY